MNDCVNMYICLNSDTVVEKCYRAVYKENVCRMR